MLKVRAFLLFGALLSAATTTGSAQAPAPPPTAPEPDRTAPEPDGKGPRPDPGGPTSQPSPPPRATAPPTGRPPADSSGSSAEAPEEPEPDAPGGRELRQPPAPEPKPSDTRASAAAADPPSRRGLLRWAHSHEPQGLTCVPQGALVHEGRGYVACGTAGVWVCDHARGVGWTLSEQIAVEGAAVGVKLHGGEPVAELLPTVTTPLPTLRASPWIATSEPCDSLRVKAAELEGLSLTLHTRSRPCLVRRHRIVLRDSAGDPLAVARVMRSTSRKIYARVGYQEAIDPRHIASIEDTRERLTSSPVNPKRPSSLWIARLSTRPLVGPGSGGLMTEVSLDYVFPRNGFLRAEAAPLGVAKGETFDLEKGPRVGVVTAAFSGGVDARLFALGAGIGASTFKGRIFGGSNSLPPGWGTTFPLFVRVGSRDGLNLQLRGNATLVFSKLRFSYLSGRLQAPLRHYGAMLMKIEGGAAGAVLGEVGARHLLRGNAGAGSLFLEWGIGGGSVVQSECEPPRRNAGVDFTGCFVTGETVYNGMLFSLGLDMRF